MSEQQLSRSTRPTALNSDDPRGLRRSTKQIREAYYAQQQALGAQPMQVQQAYGQHPMQMQPQMMLAQQQS